MKTSLKIVIASVGRFHVLDLARELDKLGHQVTFFSIVPSWRARVFDLPAHCSRSLFWIFTPLIALTMVTTGRTRKIVDLILAKALDCMVSLLMPRCDVFIGMSHVYVRSEKKAKSRFGALTICERGSTHALHQVELLKSLGSNDVSITPTINRELICYSSYDYIAIPAEHVAKSFTKMRVPDHKLIVNPYAVDHEQFSPGTTKNEISESLTAIFVGRWGLRKGADLLLDLQRRRPFKLVHVGPVDDFPLPSPNANFISMGPVDQRELIEHYRTADFAVLLSREEGLALVQAQALACGLPLLCSQHTGGSDLKNLIEHPNAIIEVDIGDPLSIEKGLVQISNFTKALTDREIFWAKKVVEN